MREHSAISCAPALACNARTLDGIGFSSPGRLGQVDETSLAQAAETLPAISLGAASRQLECAGFGRSVKALWLPAAVSAVFINGRETAD